jgi:tetratricopeptide (TPR) repeat protein/transcriptional regulator with XRE-family HTH domain
MAGAPDDGPWQGLWLRQLREAAGLTQEQLAQRSGMSTRAIGDLERGQRRKPYPRSIRLVGAALGLSEIACDDLVARYRVALREGGKRGGDTAQPTPSMGTGLTHDGPTGKAPRELPPAIAQFAGRAEELKTLDTSLDQPFGNGAAGVPAIVAIAGMAGVGKTALALHWAHRVAGRFPDGQLFAGLRGFGPGADPVPPGQVVRRFLGALGVAPQSVPGDADAQAAMYRSTLAGRRVLVVLDNARDAAQVRPLLPGSAGCMVVVTSRSQLTGLAAVEGAQVLALGLLTGQEARELLARRLGPERVAAEPEAVDELVGLCARLPLALAIAAARAAHPLAALAAELRAVSGPLATLDGLDAGEPAASVRAVFSWSYEQLSPEAARMFRLLGLHPGPDISAPAAASLDAVAPTRARRLLAELTCAHLCTEQTPGRYGVHDLLRAYAAEQVRALDNDPARRAATARMLDHYLHTAYAAASLRNPSHKSLSLPPPEPGVTAEHPADHRQALAWFENERHVLLATATLAAQAGFDRHAWQLPWTIRDYLDHGGHWHDLVTIQRSALDAAARLGDTGGQAVTHRNLAAAYAQRAAYHVARDHLVTSIELYRRLGDRGGQARAQLTLGWVFACEERHAEALGCSERAREMFETIGDQVGHARALSLSGWYCAHLGRYRQSRTFCQQALALLQQLGHRSYEAESWQSLGYAEQRSGDHRAAAACYQHALGLFRELGDRYSQATVLTHLGDAQHAAGQTQAARAAWREAVNILDALHHSDASKVSARLRQARWEQGGPASP